MNLETDNQRAYDLTADSWLDISVYRRSREWVRLETAEAKLEQAINEDPNYLQANYYRAMVNDLIGRSEVAIEQFEKVLQERPPFVEDVRYNLAVAHYHRYNHSHLDLAAEHFQTVIRNATDPTLKMLARAQLAQTYAMRMIQPKPAQADLGAVARYFELSREQYATVIHSLEELPSQSDEPLNDIKWEVYNGHGMSLMYYTDYFGTPEEKIKNLGLALAELRKADEHSPKNWANYCDLGSVHMRMGFWSASQDEFKTALNYLGEVVSSLRPNYGFASYETGRTYRLMGEFEAAREWLDKALAIEYEYRAVSDSRIEIEKARVASRSQQYP